MDLNNRLNGNELPRPIKVFAARDPKDPIMDTDIHYRFPKVDETHREAWGFKYVHFPDFSVVLGLGGMAWVLKFADGIFDTPSNAWKIISILTAIVFGLLLLAITAKLIFYPKRIFMDFEHPMRRNAAAMIPIGFCICSGLAQNVNHKLQLAMWWMGAPLSAVSLVFTIIYYLRNRQMGGTYNPSVMIPILANFVAAMTAPMLVTNQSATFTAGYMEAANWFFGIAVLFGAFTMAGTMYHGVFFTWAVDRARGSIAIWMGACFICCIAYNIVFSKTTFDSFAYTMYSCGVCLYLTIIYLIYPGRWLLVGNFEPTHWGLGFPLHTFAIASFQYYKSQGHAFSLGMCWVSMVSCTFATACFFSHSVNKLLRRQWPGPCVEGSPMAFNHFVHEAIREVMVRLRNELQVTQPNQTELTTRGQTRIKELAGEFFRVLRVNQHIKRQYVFPELMAVNKTQVRMGDEMSAKLQKICENAEAHLKDGDVEALRTFISAQVLDQIADVIDWQEDHLPPIIHKGINTRIATIIMERTWEFIDLDDLEHMCAFTFRYLPKQMHRVKFIKGLTGTLPERCQQIGLWLYRGALLDPLGDIKFSMLIDVAPEVIPRGMGIRWTRQM
jgi:tellurite resistance protein TehA-like permease